MVTSRSAFVGKLRSRRGELAETVLHVQSNPARRQAVNLSLKGFYELAKRAQVYVGGDTGPTHLAIAAGAPIVGLFGPTEWWRNGSREPKTSASNALTSIAAPTAIVAPVPSGSAWTLKLNECCRRSTERLKGRTVAFACKSLAQRVTAVTK